jgi:hypothetical protein
MHVDLAFFKAAVQTVLLLFILCSDDSSTELVERLSAETLVRGCQKWTIQSNTERSGSNLARVVNLVPRIPNERNSGALSPEPFDMSGLNFQSLKRVEVVQEALEIG